MRRLHITPNEDVAVSPVCLLILLVGLSGQSRGSAAEAPPKDENLAKTHAADVLKLAKQEAAKWKFSLAADSTARLALQPESLLHWSNPITGPVYGEVFVWTARGRPEVVAAVYKFYSVGRRHAEIELHSLSLQKLVATRDGRQVWSPARAGVELRPIPEAPAVAASPISRLRQMKALAREFSAQGSYANNKSLWNLRLMPQPIYRYRSTNPDLPDGAIFTFVRGTNPDVLLLIEARRRGGGHQWQYALARVHFVPLRVYHKGQKVWSVPRRGGSLRRIPLEPYIVFPVPTKMD